MSKRTTSPKSTAPATASPPPQTHPQQTIEEAAQLLQERFNKYAHLLLSRDILNSKEDKTP